MSLTACLNSRAHIEKNVISKIWSTTKFDTSGKPEIGHVDCCSVLYCAFFSVYYSLYQGVLDV